MPPQDHNPYSYSHDTQHTQHLQRYTIASPWARLLARLLDSVFIGFGIALLAIIALLALVAVPALGDFHGLSTTSGVLAVVGVIIFITVFYEIAMIAIKGQTLGKMVAHIKVVRSDNQQIPRWGKSFGPMGSAQFSWNNLHINPNSGDRIDRIDNYTTCLSIYSMGTKQTRMARQIGRYYCHQNIRHHGNNLSHSSLELRCGCHTERYQ